MNNKILLAFVYNDQNRADMEEIGISMIAAVLRKNQFECTTYMQHINKFEYNKIIQTKPSIIGFTVYNVTKSSVYEAIEKLKMELPNCHIFVGGATPTFYGKDMLLENPNIDYVVKGEGEYTVLELVSALIAGNSVEHIKGIIYRKDGIIVDNPERPLIKNLDELPMCEHDALFQNDLHIANIYTSRGCNGNCNFCAKQKFWNGWRGRCIQKAVDEIEYLANKKGIKCFNFLDSAFEDPDFSMRRSMEIANEILKRNLKIAYYCFFRSEVCRIATDKELQFLRESGLRTAFIGIESFNNDDLHYYNKRANVEDNVNVMELFKRNDIYVSPGIITFNPKSTFVSLKENLHHFKNYDITNKFFTKLSVYKGTRAYEQLDKENMLLDDSNNFFGYKFYDDIVGRFANQLFSLQNKMNEEHELITEYFDYICDYYYTIMSYFKWYSETNNLKAFTKIIEDTIIIHNELNHKYSSLLYDTFIYMIDNYSINLCQNEFESIFFSKMPIEEFISFRKQLLNNENRFLKQMIRHAPELIKYYKSTYRK